jgi:hypothetical protein
MIPVLSIASLLVRLATHPRRYQRIIDGRQGGDSSSGLAANTFVQ